jgi:polyribonucleotide nucleotidyltransferase
MEAGVGIPKHVSGVAMGLISKEISMQFLSDILGDEDHYRGYGFTSNRYKRWYLRSADGY